MIGKFKQALKTLNIEDYGERIFKSNSRGELFHLEDYIVLAEIFKDADPKVSGFREWFEYIVLSAEQTWQQPKSVFQHILRIYNDPDSHAAYIEWKYHQSGSN